MISSDPKAESSTGLNGAMTRQVRYQPKYGLFSMLVRLWILPSIGSMLVIILGGTTWAGSGSWHERLARVSFEQWIGLGILTAHFLFGYLALRYRRIESFREETVDLSDPNAPPHPADPGHESNVGR
ncbi:MAG: hypothetical protein H7X97_11610 [Opitutaceae bacterium]|nr:hypothetical protein [Verrucomicrobiales bacterium]